MNYFSKVLINKISTDKRASEDTKVLEDEIIVLMMNFWWNINEY